MDNTPEIWPFVYFVRKMTVTLSNFQFSKGMCTNWEYYGMVVEASGPTGIQLFLTVQLIYFLPWVMNLMHNFF